MLAAADSDLTVAWSLLVISGLQILVLAIVALAAVGRLLAAQREGETALLVARGATRWQLTSSPRPRWSRCRWWCLSSARWRASGWRARWSARGRWATAGIRLAGQPGVWPDALAAAIVVAFIAMASLLAPGLTAVARAHGGRRGSWRG